MMKLGQNISRFKSGNAILMALLLVSFLGFGQQQVKEQQKALKASQNYLSEAQQALQKEDFRTAEADYRKAISANPKNDVAKYNLGTAYYGKEKNAEAMLRFKQAAAAATTKAEKHKAFHNLGNTFMNEKKYQEAVEAYKNALRNNPNDDETRYNLALAMEMLDKNPPPPDNKDNKDDNKDINKDQENKDQDQDQDKQDNQDNQDKDKGDDKEDKDKGEKKDEKKQDEKENGEPDQPKDDKGDKPQQQQPVPGQLSPQQVKSLLEAMNNEEKKVQEKINAEKQKGTPVKSDKDW